MREVLQAGPSILIPRVNVVVPVWKYVMIRVKVIVKPLTQVAVLMWKTGLLTVPATMPQNNTILLLKRTKRLRTWYYLSGSRTSRCEMILWNAHCIFWLPMEGT